MLISNLSREQTAAREIHIQMVKAGIKIGQMVDLLCHEGGEPLPYLGPTLSNLSQLGEWGALVGNNHHHMSLRNSMCLTIYKIE